MLDHLRQLSERVAVVSVAGARRLARRVRQEVADRQRRAALQRHAELRDGCIQIEAVLFHQLQDHRRRIWFRERRQVIDRVFPCGDAAFHVGHPEATRPHHALVLGDRCRHAGNAKPLAERLQLDREVLEIVHAHVFEVRLTEREPAEQNDQQSEGGDKGENGSSQHGGSYEPPEEYVRIATTGWPAQPGVRQSGSDGSSYTSHGR